MGGRRWKGERQGMKKRRCFSFIHLAGWLICLLAFSFSLAAAEAPSSGLILSEALTANCGSFVFHGLRGSDAVELLNLGPDPVMLSDYCLSDSKYDLGRYPLPKVSLRPGQFYVLLCSEDVRRADCAPFQLSPRGETLYLSASDGRLVDRLKIPPLSQDVSYGRGAGGKDVYFPTFTPGEPNGDGFPRVASRPVISVPSGGYAAPVTVFLSGEEPIHYTLDGSVPTLESPLYTEPLRIESTAALRAVSMPAGAVPSPAATALYRFDCGDYHLATLTVTVPPRLLNGGGDALLSHPQDRSLQVPSVVTCLSPDGSLEFQQDCGLGISGQTTRERTYRGWKLKFRDKYGAGALKAEVFPGCGVESIDSLNLRVGSSFNPTQDALGSAIGAEAMPAVLTQRFRPVNLFINDTFYGIYMIRENINPAFVVSRLGGDEESVDIIYLSDTVEEGSGEDWNALLSFCRTHDLSLAENYAWVTERVNPESFADYYLWRAYTGDTDHPNIRFARSREAADPRWHLIMYDLDWAFQLKNKTAVSLKTYAYVQYDSGRHNNVVLFAMLNNASFRELFLSRMELHMRSTFTPERVLPLLEDILAQTLPDMPATWAVRRANRTKWNAAVEETRQFVTAEWPARRKLLLRETMQFFHLSEEEMAARFGSLWTE